MPMPLSVQTVPDRILSAGGRERPASMRGGRPSSPQTTEASLSQLYTVAEVCEATRLSESTIRRAIRLKHLAAVRVGRAVRLAGADVDAWLDRNRKKRR
jgi:excisionase family DNA binding protein